MPQPVANDEAAQQLIDVYQAAQHDLEALLAEVLKAPSKSAQAARIRRLIGSVKATAEGMLKAHSEWLTLTLPEIHALGAQAAAEAVGTSFAWTLPHQEAVQAYAETIWTDVAANLQNMAQDTRNVLRGWAEDQTRAALLEAKTAVQAGKDLAAVAGENGLFTVEYANGAKHLVADYAQTVTRTTTATAYNKGSVTQCRGDGIEYVQYLDGPDCGVDGHDDDQKADGMVVALDDVVEISHPNCRRALAPWVDGKVADGADMTVGPSRPTVPGTVPAKPSRTPRKARAARRSRFAAS